MELFLTQLISNSAFSGPFSGRFGAISNLFRIVSDHFRTIMHCFRIVCFRFFRAVVFVVVVVAVVIVGILVQRVNQDDIVLLCSPKPELSSKPHEVSTRKLVLRRRPSPLRKLKN